MLAMEPENKISKFPQSNFVLQSRLEPSAKFVYCSIVNLIACIDRAVSLGLYNSKFTLSLGFS